MTDCVEVRYACEKQVLERAVVNGSPVNDLEMIQFAGHGVAMGNACDALKDAADEVTLTNNEDGIAHTLNHLLGCR